MMTLDGKVVVFGLVAQGHIPTIEAIIKRWNDGYIADYPDEPLNMMYSKHVWEEIGRTIGWCPFTACLDYFEYLQSKCQCTGTVMIQRDQDTQIPYCFDCKKVIDE